MEVYFRFKIEAEPMDTDIYSTLAEALSVAQFEWNKLAYSPICDYYPTRQNGTVTVFAFSGEENEQFAGCKPDALIMKQDFNLKVEE